jgi:hypothetical protein
MYGVGETGKTFAQATGDLKASVRMVNEAK